MVSRTAYAQLRYSPVLLAGTVLGLALTYLAPVALALFADGVAQFIGVFVWALMAVAFRPTLRFYGLSRLWAPALPAIAAAYMAFTRGFRLSACARPWRHVEGPRTGQSFGICNERCGRKRRQELAVGQRPPGREFPGRVVAHSSAASRGRSWRSTISCAPPTISPTTRRLPPPKSFPCSIASKPGCCGANDEDAAAVRLRTALAARELSPKHAQDLIAAFKLDVTKLRYRDWDDLIGYCSLSAMPVGRFVSTSTARAAPSGRPTMRCAPPCRSSITSGLQGRLSQPQPRLYSAGRACRERQRRSRRSAAARHRRRCSIACTSLPSEPKRLLSESDGFAASINDWRLGLEVSVINTLAHRLTRLLRTRDPLSDTVHLSAARGRRLHAARCPERRIAASRPAAAPPPRRSPGVRE